MTATRRRWIWSAGSNQQLVYLMRAVTPGRYLVPPTQVEDMYRPEIRAVGEDIHEGAYL